MNLINNYMLKQADYFKTNNGYLTRSKIQDFRLSPDYFRRKHIEGSIKDKDKDCYRIGSATDDLLAQIGNKSNYVITDREFRSNVDKAWKAEQEAAGKIVVKQAEYEKIMSLAIAVEETEAYQHLNTYPRQVLLQCEYPFANNSFHGLAALPDFAKITTDSADICDLKTTTGLATWNERKWQYKCQDLGYFLQFALQTIILSKQGIKNFTYRHLVVDKTENINNVYAILIDSQFVEDEIDSLLETINDIGSSDFKKPIVSWANPNYLEKNPSGDDELFDV